MKATCAFPTRHARSNARSNGPWRTACADRRGCVTLLAARRGTVRVSLATTSRKRGARDAYSAKGSEFGPGGKSHCDCRCCSLWVGNTWTAGRRSGRRFGQPLGAHYQQWLCQLHPGIDDGEPIRSSNPGVVVAVQREHRVARHRDSAADGRRNGERIDDGDHHHDPDRGGNGDVLHHLCILCYGSDVFRRQPILHHSLAHLCTCDAGRYG